MSISSTLLNIKLIKIIFFNKFVLIRNLLQVKLYHRGIGLNIKMLTFMDKLESL